jgi:hypothetical protein
MLWRVQRAVHAAVACAPRPAFLWPCQRAGAGHGTLLLTCAPRALHMCCQPGTQPRAQFESAQARSRHIWSLRMLFSSAQVRRSSFQERARELRSMRAQQHRSLGAQERFRELGSTETHRARARRPAGS